MPATVPDGLAVRHPTGRDHARVLAVVDAWWGGLGGAAGSRQRAALLHRLFLDHFADTSFVVERADGRLAGFLVGFLSQSEPGVAYIHLAGVDPELRRAGLGRRLYDRFFDVVMRRGADTVRCITSPANTTSIAFHRGIGFAVDPSPGHAGGIPVQRDHDGPGVDRVSFTRRLSPSRARTTATQAGDRDPEPEIGRDALAAPADGSDVTALLRDLSPRLHDGAYVYATVAGGVPAGAEPVVVVREAEGLSLVVPRTRADALGLPYGFVAAWITLDVHSALDAVGLTAAVSRALADAGISANVVAGHAHDHLFVPHERAEEAMEVLTALATG